MIGGRPVPATAIAPDHVSAGRRFEARRQASEQYRTRSQSRSHFFRHANGRPQTGQTFAGRSVSAALRGTAGLTGRGSHLTVPGSPPKTPNAPGRTHG